MEWTPLIAASDFLGIRTDLGTAVTGLMSLALILVGVGVLFRVFSR
jgi:uncharacterized membrane-anchored protein